MVEPEHAVVPYRALDLTLGPWLLVQYERRYGMRHVSYDGISLTPEHDGSADYTLTLLNRETGRQISARFHWDPRGEQWICPAFNYVVTAAVMDAAIARAVAEWTHLR